MRLVRIIGAVVCSVALVGCAKAPTQDMEFARGCWAEKAAPGGPVTAMLRLLPPAPNGLALTGMLTHHAPDGSTVGRMTQFRILRDGSQLGMLIYAKEARIGPLSLGPSLDHVARPISDADIANLPSHERVASFGRNEFAELIFLGGKESLTILAKLGAGARLAAIFNGTRDGCD